MRENFTDTPQTFRYFEKRIEEYHSGLESYQTIRDAEFAADLERKINEYKKIAEEARVLLLPILDCRIFCSESMDIDNYATDDLISAIDKLISIKI